MVRTMIDADDLALIDAASGLIRARYAPNRHAVSCALRTRSGAIHLGVHLDCYVTRIAVCAEAVAIGRAATEGDGHDIETIVAVRQPVDQTLDPVVVAPCGMCREMISDYAPQARVIVPGDNGPRAVSVTSLLPNKYVRPE